MKFADSTKEIRYFCKNGGPTLDGSTPIYEPPTVLEEHLGMHALQCSKEDFKLSLLGLKDESIDFLEAASKGDLSGIKWYSHYLEAEEARVKYNGYVVTISEEKLMTYLATAYMNQGIYCNKILKENIEYQQKLNPDLVPYNAENFIHLHSVDSLEGIKPEHADETADT